MKRLTVWLWCLAVFGALIALAPLVPPSRASAGGLPCFLCHGVKFEGSDLAPRVAGTTLTDDEILNQIRNPRGVMPAFPEFADASIVGWIRSVPAGQPTMALPPQQRSSALATLAAVAAARATEFAQSADLGQRAANPTPTPLPTPETARAALPPASAPPVASSSPLNVFIATGTLLALIAGTFWAWQRR